MSDSLRPHRLQHARLPCPSSFPRTCQTHVYLFCVVLFIKSRYHLLWMTQMERGLEPLRVCMPSHFSCVWLFATPGTVVHQVSLSMGFSRQEYWSRLLCPPPGDLPNRGIEPESLTSPALAGRVLPLAPPGRPLWPPNWSDFFSCTLPPWGPGKWIMETTGLVSFYNCKYLSVSYLCDL